MIIFIDTNVLISSILRPEGSVAQAVNKALSPPNLAVISTQNIVEINRIFHKKFPHLLNQLDEFILRASVSFLIVIIPKEEIPEEACIRDPKDRPLIRAARAADADIFLTGDKDFLEAGLLSPRVLSPAEFLAL